MKQNTKTKGERRRRMEKKRKQQKPDECFLLFSSFFFFFVFSLSGLTRQPTARVPHSCLLLKLTSALCLQLVTGNKTELENDSMA